MRIKKFLVSLIICLITGISAFSISSCDQTEQPQDPSSGNEQTDGENNGGAEQKTEYTVTYNANGGVFADGNATMSAKTEKDAVLTAPASPQRTYYKFNGWSKNSSGTEIWNFATDTVTGDLTLYAVWKQESAVIFSVDGASIENKEIFMLVNHTVDSVSLANKIVCSDESVWKLYYDKLGQMEIPTKIAASSYGELDDGDNVFYIVVTSNDGTQVNVYELNVYRSYAVNVNYYDGNTLLKTETAYTGYEFTTTYTPNITGYTFNDWNYTARVLWDGLNLYADKTANTYKVTYNVNGGDELTTTEKTVTYDSDYTLTKPTRTGYTFLGWYYGSTQLTNSNGSSLESWGYASDKTATAKWQANEYTVTLNRNNTSAGTVTGAGDHAYDSNVTVTASTNAGYTWLGWYDKNDELVTIEYSYSFKMGFAVEYTAKWGKTTVTRNNTSAGTVTSLTGKYVNGQDVTVTATTNSGYTFLGWYNGETLLTTDTSYTFTMSSENVTYTAMWTYYTLTTDTNLSGAGTYTSCTNTKVTAGTETTLTANAYNGYTWLGWYNGDALMTDELSYTFEMTAENVTYTAKWTIAEEMQNFTFTSTATTCKITGITDKTVTEIVVPEYVTSISTGAFSGCSGLESITIPFVGGETGKATGDTYQYPFGYIFGTSEYTGGTATTQYYYGSSSTTYSTYYIPTSLKSVTVTGGNILYGAFYNCRSLTSITIPDGVTSIGGAAFYNCRSLTSITIPNSVTSIGDTAFYNCSSLTSITIPDSVTSIGGSAFYGCRGLTSITIPDSVTSIGYYAFSDCSSLTSVTIPDSVTSIVDSAFYNCSSLTSIVIPYSVTSIGYNAFVNCDSLTDIYITDIVAWCNISGLEYLTNHGFSTLNLYVDNVLLTELVIPDTVTRILSYAFGGCSSLTSVTIPNSVTSIAQYAFYNCSSLTSITIPDSVTYIGGSAFESCSSLTSITIPDSVTYIGGSAFESCSSLTGVYIMDIVAWCNISFNGYYSNPLYYAKNLYLNNELVTELKIPDGVTSIGNYAFVSCSSLTSITIPDGVTSIGGWAFSGCSSLESITIPFVGLKAGKTASDTWQYPFGYIFGTGSYTGGTATTQYYYGSSTSSTTYSTYYIPTSLKSVTVTGGNILYGAFYKCSGLTSVTIGDGVTSIGGSAFYKCSSLTSITIPNSVTSIGSKAFEYCSSLARVYYKGTAEEWSEINISSDHNGCLTSATRYYYIENEADVPTDGGNYWHYVDGVPTAWVVE